MNSVSLFFSNAGGLSRPMICATFILKRKTYRKSFLHVVSVSNFLQPASKQRHLPPLSLSINPAAVDLRELSALLAATGQNCLLFPKTHHDGTLDPVDPSKLGIALKNSMLVVSIHTSSDIFGDDYMERAVEDEKKTNWLTPIFQHKSTRKKLVAFGRAMSDRSLTASIYDLAVAPSLQRLGLGRRVMQRLIRDLVNRGIWDIAVLVPLELRPFFEACGFQSDVLNSTTMVYSRTSRSSSDKVDQSVKQYGRIHLLVPPPLKFRTSTVEQNC